MTGVHIGLAVIMILLLIQLVPVERTNPPVTERVEASPDVEGVLERACFDCHSNETRWPWYARVAPASWLLTHNVEEGRGELNFSEWDYYDAEEQIDLVDRVVEVTTSGEMPPWEYLPLHPTARLSARDTEVLQGWPDTFEPTGE